MDESGPHRRGILEVYPTDGLITLVFDVSHGVAVVSIKDTTTWHTVAMTLPYNLTIAVECSVMSDTPLKGWVESRMVCGNNKSAT